MPFNVKGNELDEAIGAALAAGRRPEVRAASDELSRLADDNVRAIAGRVSELVARGNDAEREQLAERRREQYAAIIAARREACAVDDRPAARASSPRRGGDRAPARPRPRAPDPWEGGSVGAPAPCRIEGRRRVSQ